MGQPRRQRRQRRQAMTSNRQASQIGAALGTTRMPENIRPRVNEAREFLEIAKNFKDPREIIREALSNSWDAGASKASIKFSLVPYSNSRKKKIVVEITDDGE